MRIKVIANPKKDWAEALAKELPGFLSPDHEVVRRRADATICIGGDGTILYAHYKGRIEGHILGIGAEKSYICQLRRTDWRERIKALLSAPRTSTIMSIEADVGGKAYRAINDFVVHATHYRVVDLELSIQGPGAAPGTVFEGDGMIFSSALGSAAYAYSAGGALLDPKDNIMVAVPICPYKRAFTARVLDPGSEVALRVGSDCAFIVDGIFVRKLRKNDVVRLRKGAGVSFFEGVGHYDNQG